MNHKPKKREVSVLSKAPLCNLGCLSEKHGLFVEAIAEGSFNCWFCVIVTALALFLRLAALFYVVSAVLPICCADGLLPCSFSLLA